MDKTKWITVKEIQEEYLPISRKRIRSLIKKYLDVVNVGQKMLVEREQLEEFLRNGLK